MPGAPSNCNPDFPKRRLGGATCYFQWPATVDWCSVVRHAQRRPPWPGPSPPRKIRRGRPKIEAFRTLIMTATLPTGTLLNAAGIVIGGIVGLTLRRQLTR